jgi:hypothetical protein
MLLRATRISQDLPDATEFWAATNRMAIGCGPALYSGTSGGANTTTISRSSVILVK